MPKRTQTEKKPGWSGAAQLSADGLYRYSLTRTALGHGPESTALNFVMLNPSTADAQEDDPTIRRCLGFARLWGYGRVVVTNLYAYRATKPADLWLASDPVGASNDAAILESSHGSSVIAAWGVNAKPDRVQHVMALLHQTHTVWCLGMTKAGAPRHPLYVRGDALTEEYR